MQWKVVRFPEFHHVFLDKFVFCQALAEGLKENSTLMNLYLWDNHIGPIGAEAWCSVRMVRMRRRCGSGHEGRSSLVRIEKQSFESEQ